MIILFTVLFFLVFGKLVGFAIKCAWGLSKVVLSLVFLPIAILVLFIIGLKFIAIPAIIIVGIVMLVREINKDSSVN